MRSDPHQIRAETIDGQGFTEVVFRRPFHWRSLVFFVVITAFWLFGNAFAFLLMAAMGSTVHPWFRHLDIRLDHRRAVHRLHLLWGLFSVSRSSRADSLTLMRRLLIPEDAHRNACRIDLVHRLGPDDPLRRSP